MSQKAVNSDYICDASTPSLSFPTFFQSLFTKATSDCSFSRCKTRQKSASQQPLKRTEQLIFFFFFFSLHSPANQTRLHSGKRNVRTDKVANTERRHKRSERIKGLTRQQSATDNQLFPPIRHIYQFSLALFFPSASLLPSTLFPQRQENENEMLRESTLAR